ncbi:membrane protein containing Ion transport 2 domain protein [Candidatus Magnetomorum sp. HK-1]|nr:membrane protein containing Ion transport 2 domain protein [Candidatus Magnetomorum sp. HK-1]
MQSQYQLKFYLLMFVSLIAFGTSFFQWFENLSLSDAFYFCIVTIATVGYGDISPATTPGKAMALLLIVMGAGTFLGVMANATEIVLNKRGKKVRLEKLNTMMGLFFSEAGTHLLSIFANNDKHLDTVIKKSFLINNKWQDNDFIELKKKLPTLRLMVNHEKVQFKDLSLFLNEKSDLFLRLIENPTLQEDENFTKLLISILHLKEELTARKQLKKLPESDRQHLAGDCNRAYIQLFDHWIDYMWYIKDRYPFLFSLAVRQNPFDTEASVTVRG